MGAGATLVRKGEALFTPPLKVGGGDGDLIIIGRSCVTVVVLVIVVCCWRLLPIIIRLLLLLVGYWCTIGSKGGVLFTPPLEIGDGGVGENYPMVGCGWW